MLCALHAAATWAAFAVVYELVGSAGTSRLAPAAIGALVFAVPPLLLSSATKLHHYSGAAAKTGAPSDGEHQTVFYPNHGILYES